MPENSLNIFTFGGSIAGIYSFVRLVIIDLRNWWRPTLSIEFNPNSDLANYHYNDTNWNRRFATLHVRNKEGRDTAKRCIAIARVKSSPGGVNLQQKEFDLHWAGVDYSTRTSGAEPVEIGVERRRLDVAFTIGPPEEYGKAGTWMAMPIALSMPQSAGQAFLLPGVYEIEITVSCENGKGSTKQFRLTSPGDWQKLAMQII